MVIIVDSFIQGFGLPFDRCIALVYLLEGKVHKLIHLLCCCVISVLDMEYGWSVVSFKHKYLTLNVPREQSTENFIRTQSKNLHTIDKPFQ